MDKNIDGGKPNALDALLSVIVNKLADELQRRGVVARADATGDTWLEVAKLPADLRTPVRRAIKAGKLAGAKPGRSLLVRRAELDAWIAAAAPKPREIQSGAGTGMDGDAFDAALRSGRLVALKGGR